MKESLSQVIRYAGILGITRFRAGRRPPRWRQAVDQAGSGKAASNAMANLAEAIQGLVHHMRTEQQMIRDWVDGQAEQQREIKKLLEIMARDKVER